jgi:tRNA pseudouridine38-40 synthase
LERRGELLIYRVTGSGFLKYMVRNIVGVLLEVSKGNFNDDDIRARLQPNCGIRPVLRVPPSGLILVSVEYKSDRE